MGDEHLSTIPETESDEVIKSSVKNLVPIPSESEVTSDNEKIISTRIDLHYFNVESNLLEFLLNRDTLIDYSPKFDYLLEEFSGELTYIDPIPPGIEEADFDLEEEICLAIDLFLATDDLMPPGIENEDYDSKGDIHFLEELLNNNPLPLSKNKSSNFDHQDDPSFLRPPPEPPDVEVFFDFEPDTGVLTTKVVKGISEHYVLMPNILPTLPTLDPDLDFTPSYDSLGSGNKIFDPGIFIESLSPFPILVEDSDSHIEEIDLFLATDDLMPPGIENDDYDSERDIHFLEELISNDPLPLPENESSNFDHHDDPLFPRPPLEPPDVEDPLYPVFDTLLPFSSENEDKVFKPGILSYFSCLIETKPLLIFMRTR
nr:hypothetical protein [Tanacetum cinerariifolium]